jgi:hypothetical protein
MIQHGQGCLRSLIFASPQLFDPEFMSVLWRFTTHVEQVAVPGNIIDTMLNAVILLVVLNLYMMLNPCPLSYEKTTLHLSK